ncbi:MAG: hypothetical protein JXR95_01110 [Deltaproteobacteria bacterium]|nr:hypothetical protein [Deltaproteobacteria bacterium]
MTSLLGILLFLLPSGFHCPSPSFLKLPLPGVKKSTADFRGVISIRRKWNTPVLFIDGIKKSEFPTPVYPKQIKIRGNYVIFALGHFGMQVYRVETSGKLTLILNYRDSVEIETFQIHGNMLYPMHSGNYICSKKQLSFNDNAIGDVVVSKKPASRPTFSAELFLAGIGVDTDGDLWTQSTSFIFMWRFYSNNWLGLNVGVFESDVTGSLFHAFSYRYDIAKFLHVELTPAIYVEIGDLFNPALIVAPVLKYSGDDFFIGLKTSLVMINADNLKLVVTAGMVVGMKF